MRKGRLEMEDDLYSALSEFATAYKFKGKGPLSIALIVTEQARVNGLPLDPNDLVTEGGGQVRGAGGDAAQKILNRHGIERRLSSEGGRTSRSSLGRMQSYVAFLGDLHRQGLADLDAIEAFWVQRVHEYLAGRPFRIKLDASRSLRTVIRDVIAQAVERQKEMPGVYYSGAVLQHLIGAKLDCALDGNGVEHHSASTADAPGGRAGDFLIGDVAIHATTSPSEALMAKCQDNLNDDLRPVIVTLQRGLAVAEGLAANAGIDDRIDVFELEQFIALNVYELGNFVAAGRRTVVTDLVERYNNIIDQVETDPSLKIRIGR